MNTFKIDFAYTEFSGRIEGYKAVSADANEAKTRLWIVDDILLNVLDWNKTDIEPEKYCREAGYADYILHCDQRQCLTLEAKRVGVSFTIPNIRFDDRPYTFGFLANECKEVAKALQQAIGYAATVGTRYVAISNGHQWLFTLSFVQDQPLDQRLVFVFESLDAIQRRFRRFCDCFAKSHLISNAPLASLVESLQKSPPPKLSASIPGYPQPANRNIYRNELAYILDYVWRLMSEDEGTEEFVKHCYVNPSSHSDVITLVREILSRRISEDEMLIQHSIDGADSIPQKLNQLPSQKPFVVLGEIGRGKTSFLKYLRYVAARDLLDNYIQIDINFLDLPDKASEVHDYVYDEIEKQLRETYGIDLYEDSFVRGVLHLDLERFRKTPEGIVLSKSPDEYSKGELQHIRTIVSNRHAYFAKAFHHLKRGRRHSLAIFFDNLDRRSPEIQEEAFLKSSAIARDWACLVFVCLRPDTFHKSQEKGVLDTIAPQTFTVSHPDLSVVLKKRFSYAKLIAEGSRLPHKISAGGLSREIAFDLPSVAKILGCCEFSAWKRHGVIPMLEAVANGNIRRMLAFAKAILCSGHLDTKKILSKIEGGGTYSIPDFEGVKALLYGEYMQYDPSSSPFVNLFDIVHASSLEHFVRLSILRYLAGFPHDGVDAGYVSRSQLGAYLNGCGFSLNAIETSIDALLRKELCRIKLTNDDVSKNEQSIRITSLGKFHLLNLPKLFQYLDAVLVDTPITDSDVRASIKEEQYISERLSRTRLFLSYLDKSAESLSDSQLKSFWKELSEAAWTNMAEIEEKIK